MARNNTRDAYYVTLLAGGATPRIPPRMGGLPVPPYPPWPLAPGLWRRARELPQRPQHVLHDAAVPVVVGLAWRVDPHDHVEFLAIGSHHEFVRDYS